MASWASRKTSALKNLEKSLKNVDGVLSFMSNSPGQPSSAERALYAAAVVFIYGIWENYCEQLAIELGERVSSAIAPEEVPSKVRKTLEKHTAWELSVHPGWRHLWSKKIETIAVGDGGEKFGLNTAKAGQVSHLLEMVGVTSPFSELGDDIPPDHLPDSCVDSESAINALVELRGEIVHTGSVPRTLRKHHINEWREFLEEVTKELDKECRKQCKTLVP